MTLTSRKRLCYFVGSLFVTLTIIDLMSPADGLWSEVDCETLDGEVCVTCEMSPECAKPAKWIVLKKKLELGD